MNQAAKMKQYDSFTEWKQDQSSENQKLIDRVSKIASTIAPQLDKVVKWGQGCWADNGRHKFYIHCKPDHIQLGFYIGSSLKDPEELLQGKGKYVRYVKISSNKDIDAEAFEKLIKQVL